MGRRQLYGASPIRFASAPSDSALADEGCQITHQHSRAKRGEFRARKGHVRRGKRSHKRNGRPPWRVNLAPNALGTAHATQDGLVTGHATPAHATQDALGTAHATPGMGWGQPTLHLNGPRSAPAATAAREGNGGGGYSTRDGARGQRLRLQRRGKATVAERLDCRERQHDDCADRVQLKIGSVLI